MSGNGKIIVLAVAAGVAFMVWQKTQAGAVRQLAPASPGAPTRNVNSDMMSRIFGAGWRNLLSAGQNASAGNGYIPFVMSDGYGEYMTSDGRPVSTGDVYQDFTTAGTGLAPLIDERYGSQAPGGALYDSAGDLLIGNWTTNGGISPLDLLSGSPKNQAGSFNWY